MVSAYRGKTGFKEESSDGVEDEVMLEDGGGDSWNSGTSENTRSCLIRRRGGTEKKRERR